MRIIQPIALVVALVLVAAACSADPTTSQQDPGLEQAPATTSREAAELNQQSESIAAMVMKAWATGDPADIEAVYADDVHMVLDGDTWASDREELADVINSSKVNTYRQVGPVAAYVFDDGDTYIATLVVVTGMGHPAGAPLVGFYRVRDGRVTRHVFFFALDY